MSNENNIHNKMESQDTLDPYTRETTTNQIYREAFGRKADNLDDHPFHFPSRIHLWSPILTFSHDWISAGLESCRESRNAMVLAEKSSSCIRTVNRGRVPSTSASYMHVLASHPATTTPCLPAILSKDVSIIEMTEDLNSFLSLIVRLGCQSCIAKMEKCCSNLFSAHM